MTWTSSSSGLVEYKYRPVSIKNKTLYDSGQWIHNALSVYFSSGRFSLGLVFNYTIVLWHVPELAWFTWGGNLLSFSFHKEIEAGLVLCCWHFWRWRKVDSHDAKTGLRPVRDGSIHWMVNQDFGFSKIWYIKQHDEIKLVGFSWFCWVDFGKCDWRQSMEENFHHYELNRLEEWTLYLKSVKGRYLLFQVLTYARLVKR